ncbi:MAG: ferritin-like domain-containing protein [Acidimicrobiia bacterium]|nr:ferritin-like domain-containing protein [Acidimicrobiia bacterium]
MSAIPEGTARSSLVRQLQAAYSGELAAAYSYRGHWRSLTRPREREQRDEDRRIEEAEWHHRRLVGELLAELGAGPSRRRELVMGTIGRVFGSLCHVSGWLLPMLFAGRLEAMNVGQYDTAARAAGDLGLAHWVPVLEEMTAEEGRHEAFFAACARTHRFALLSRVVGWRLPHD